MSDGFAWRREKSDNPLAAGPNFGILFSAKEAAELAAKEAAKIAASKSGSAKDLDEHLDKLARELVDETE